jgi:hypothetical protein
MEGWNMPPALVASGVLGPSLSKRIENPARKEIENQRGNGWHMLSGMLPSRAQDRSDAEQEKTVQ